jgi:hypothetical protein
MLLLSPRKARQSRALIEAEAEARGLELIALALQDSPDLLNYQYITKISPNVQIMLVPSNSPFLLPFPEMNQASSVVQSQANQSEVVQPTPTPPFWQADSPDQPVELRWLSFETKRGSAGARAAPGKRYFQ